MIAIRLQSMALFTALILAPQPGLGAPWRASEQPKLKEALERAPVLQTESLGEPARGVNVWERWLVPNHDGKSWDLLQIYFKEYYGPTWLCAVDFGSGEVKLQRLPDNHQFYLSGRALGFDGKYYIATPSRSPAVSGVCSPSPKRPALRDFSFRSPARTRRFCRGRRLRQASPCSRTPTASTR
jgi:hypothetical protein